MAARRLREARLGQGAASLHTSRSAEFEPRFELPSVLHTLAADCAPSAVSVSDRSVDTERRVYIGPVLQSANSVRAERART